jgi:protein phosphatase PTC6
VRALSVLKSFDGTHGGCNSQQEDYYAYATLSLDPVELQLSHKRTFGLDWQPQLVNEQLAGQVVFVGIYDG